MFRGHSILIYFAVCATSLAGWNANIWPASNTSPRYVVATNIYAKDMWSWQCYSALVERATVLGIAPPDLPTFFRFEKANIDAMKDWISDNCTNFVDLTLATNGNYNGWFNDTNNTWFPLLSKTVIIDRLALPTNFFDYTPWRAINESPNGWDGVYNCITSLSSTAYTISNNIRTNVFYDGYVENNYFLVSNVHNCATVLYETGGSNIECGYVYSIATSIIEIVTNNWIFDDNTLIDKNYYCMVDDDTYYVAEAEYDCDYLCEIHYTIYNSCDSVVDSVSSYMSVSHKTINGLQASVQLYERAYRAIPEDYIIAVTNPYTYYSFSSNACEAYPPSYGALIYTEETTSTQITENINILNGIPTNILNKYYTDTAGIKSVTNDLIVFDGLAYEHDATAYDILTNSWVIDESKTCNYDELCFKKVLYWSGYDYISQTYSESYGVNKPAALYNWNFDYK